MSALTVAALDADELAADRAAGQLAALGLHEQSERVRWLSDRIAEYVAERDELAGLGLADG